MQGVGLGLLYVVQLLLMFVSLWRQVRFLKEQPAHIGGHPWLQCRVRPGHRDEPDGHHQTQQVVQVLNR